MFIKSLFAKHHFHCKSLRVIHRQDPRWLASYVWVTCLSFETLSLMTPHSKQQVDWARPLFMTNETQRRLTHGIGRKRSPREALFDEIMLWKQKWGFPCFPRKKILQMNLLLGEREHLQRRNRALKVCQSIWWQFLCRFGNNCDGWSKSVYKAQLKYIIY